MCCRAPVVTCWLLTPGRREWNWRKKTDLTSLRWTLIYPTSMVLKFAANLNSGIFHVTPQSSLFPSDLVRKIDNAPLNSAQLITSSSLLTQRISFPEFWPTANQREPKTIMFVKYPPQICKRRRQNSRPDGASMRAWGSNVPSEFSHTTFEGLRNLGKGFKGNLLFRPFDVANVISRQIGLFRQLLLAQTSLLPLGANGFPQNAINSARR